MVSVVKTTVTDMKAIAFVAEATAFVTKTTVFASQATLFVANKVASKLDKVASQAHKVLPVGYLPAFSLSAVQNHETPTGESRP